MYIHMQCKNEHKCIQILQTEYFKLVQSKQKSSTDATWSTKPLLLHPVDCPCTRVCLALILSAVKSHFQDADVLDLSIHKDIHTYLITYLTHYLLAVTKNG
jgi:hypothetical protein